MGARLLLVVLLILTCGLFRFAGTAYSQDDYYYICYTPDGSYFESDMPCDYDYGYPGLGYFDFGFASRNYRNRDFGNGGRGFEYGGGMRDGGAAHGGEGHEKR